MGSSWGRRRGGRYGAEYDKFRTGLTYSDVRSMLWSNDFDPAQWRYKRRGTVLGLWHSLKQDMWMEKERREDEEVPGDGDSAHDARPALRQSKG